MKDKFAASMILALLLSGLSARAQQAGAIAGNARFACSNLLHIPNPLKTLACEVKPSGTGSQRLSRNFIQSDNNGTYISFDVPGDTNGTYPYAINAAGMVTGYWVDAAFKFHGFVRDYDGNINTFDVPGDTGGTYPDSIGSNGTVTGYYFVTAGHGFVRDQHGVITSFDVPNSTGTFPTGIDSGGEITGSFLDPSSNEHGFVRAQNGSFISFDPPDGGSTMPFNIADSGAIAGQYLDSYGTYLCFLRGNDGTFSRVQPPGAVGTFGCYVNSSSTVTGLFCDSTGAHGFLRDNNGNYTSFDAPGVQSPSQCTPPYGPFTGTLPRSINSPGTIAGMFLDSSYASHGFVRNSNGTMTVLDVPGEGDGYYQGTDAFWISDGGVVTGQWTDSSNNNHGFIWISH